MTRCTATIAAATASRSALPSMPWTNTIVATIAPGPASNGVPSGTSAAFTFCVASGSVAVPVSSCSATRSSSSPPAACSAGNVIPR